MGYYGRRLAKQSRPLPSVSHLGSISTSAFPWEYLPLLISIKNEWEKIFGDLEIVVVYLDDLMVYSSNEYDHLEHIRVVFDRLHKYGVTLNGKQCYIL